MHLSHERDSAPSFGQTHEDNPLTKSLIGRVTENYEKRTLPNYRVKEKRSNRQVVIEHVQRKTEIVIDIEEVKVESGALSEGETTAVYRNLPDCLLPLLENYSSNELLNNPCKVLRSICRIQAVMGDSSGD